MSGVVVVVVLFHVHRDMGEARISMTSHGVWGRAKLWYYVQSCAPRVSNSFQ